MKKFSKILNLAFLILAVLAGVISVITACKNNFSIMDLAAVVIVSVAGAFFGFRNIYLQQIMSNSMKQLQEKSDRLDLVIRGTGVGVWDWNVKTGALVLNEQWAEMLGYTLSELEPISINTWARLAHPDDLKGSDEKLKEHFEFKTEMYDYECRIRHKDGSWVWVHDKGKVYERAPDGTPVRMAGTHYNITENKKAVALAEKYRADLMALLNNLPFLAWIKDSQGHFLAVNKPFAEACGMNEPEKVIGKTDFDIWPAELAVEYVNADNRVIRSGKKTSLEEIVKEKGMEKWFETYKAPLFGPSGEPAGTVGLARDITDKKTAEQKLRESEEKHRSLFETMAQGVVYQNTDGRIISANPSAEKILGVSFAEMSVRTSETPEWRTLHEDGTEFPGEEHPAMRALRSGREEESIMGIYNPRKNGYIWADVRAVPMFREGEKKPYQVYATITDITERKEREREKEKLYAELQEKSAEMERFVYTVSHDLKNPLVTIQGFAGILKKKMHETGADGSVENLEMIIKAARSMNSLLNDLLEISRIGRVINKYEPVLFCDMARAAKELVHGEAQSCGADIIIERSLCDKNLKGAFVNCDRKRITEVLQNLVSNSLKFRLEKVKPVINIGVDNKRESTPVYYVKDNGIGMETRYLSRIFELFERLDNSVDGTGIGLAIVKRIVEMHGGRIWAESEGPGRGSSFYFTFGADKYIS